MYCQVTCTLHIGNVNATASYSLSERNICNLGNGDDGEIGESLSEFQPPPWGGPDSVLPSPLCTIGNNYESLLLMHGHFKKTGVQLLMLLSSLYVLLLHTNERLVNFSSAQFVFHILYSQYV